MNRRNVNGDRREPNPTIQENAPAENEPAQDALPQQGAETAWAGSLAVFGASVVQSLWIFAILGAMYALTVYVNEDYKKAVEDDEYRVVFVRRLNFLETVWNIGVTFTGLGIDLWNWTLPFIALILYIAIQALILVFRVLAPFSVWLPSIATTFFVLATIFFDVVISVAAGIGGSAAAGGYADANHETATMMESGHVTAAGNMLRAGSAAAAQNALNNMDVSAASGGIEAFGSALVNIVAGLVDLMIEVCAALFPILTPLVNVIVAVVFPLFLGLVRLLSRLAVAMTPGNWLQQMLSAVSQGVQLVTSWVGGMCSVQYLTAVVGCTIQQLFHLTFGEITAPLAVLGVTVPETQSCNVGDVEQAAACVGEEAVELTMAAGAAVCAPAVSCVSSLTAALGAALDGAHAATLCTVRALAVQTCAATLAAPAAWPESLLAARVCEETLGTALDIACGNSTVPLPGDVAAAACANFGSTPTCSMTTTGNPLCAAAGAPLCPALAAGLHLYLLDPSNTGRRQKRADNGGLLLTGPPALTVCPTGPAQPGVFVADALRCAWALPALFRAPGAPALSAALRWCNVRAQKMAELCAVAPPGEPLDSAGITAGVAAGMCSSAVREGPVCGHRGGSGGALASAVAGNSTRARLLLSTVLTTLAIAGAPETGDVAAGAYGPVSAVGRTPGGVPGTAVARAAQLLGGSRAQPGKVPYTRPPPPAATTEAFSAVEAAALQTGCATVMASWQLELAELRLGDDWRARVEIYCAAVVGSAAYAGAHVQTMSLTTTASSSVSGSAATCSPGGGNPTGTSYLALASESGCTREVAESVYVAAEETGSSDAETAHAASGLCAEGADVLVLGPPSSEFADYYNNKTCVGTATKTVGVNAYGTGPESAGGSALEKNQQTEAVDVQLRTQMNAVEFRAGAQNPGATPGVLPPLSIFQQITDTGGLSPLEWVSSVQDFHAKSPVFELGPPTFRRLNSEVVLLQATRCGILGSGFAAADRNTCVKRALQRAGGRKLLSTDQPASESGLNTATQAVLMAQALRDALRTAADQSKFDKKTLARVYNASLEALARRTGGSTAGLEAAPASLDDADDPKCTSSMQEPYKCCTASSPSSDCCRGLYFCFPTLAEELIVVQTTTETLNTDCESSFFSTNLFALRLVVTPVFRYLEPRMRGSTRQAVLVFFGWAIFSEEEPSAQQCDCFFYNSHYVVLAVILIFAAILAYNAAKPAILESQIQETRQPPNQAEQLPL